MSNCCLTGSAPFFVTGTGTTIDPYVLGMRVGDSDGVSLSQAGGVLVGSPIIDPDPTNSLECGEDGLTTPAVDNVYINSDFVNFVLAGSYTLDAVAFPEYITPELDSTITNESDCRKAWAYLFVGGDVPVIRLFGNAVSGAGTRLDLYLEVSINGSAFEQIDYQIFEYDSVTPARTVTVQNRYQQVPLPIIELQPDESATVTIRRRYVAVVGQPEVATRGALRVESFVMTAQDDAEFLI